jgi:hypothetical protein
MILFNKSLNIKRSMENTLATSSVDTFSDLCYIGLGGVLHNRFSVRCCLLLKFWRSYFLNHICILLIYNFNLF